MSDQLSQELRHWWVTQSEKRQVHWTCFFTGKDPKRGKNWEGGGWIKDKVSFNRIAQMKRNDIVVAYQADEGIIGLARLDSPGYPDPKGKGKHCDTFDLNTQRFVRLSECVPYPKIHALPSARKHIEFDRQHEGTVKSIDPTGWKMIRDLILKSNPDQREEIKKFLKTDLLIKEAKLQSDDGELTPAHRKKTTIQRIIRDSAEGKRLKQDYGYKCQVCNETIELPNGDLYAEVHHVRPLGEHGKDGRQNTIVVCPKHHVMFDLRAITITPKSFIVKHWNPDGGEKDSPLIRKHRLDSASIDYQYKKFKEAIES